MQQSSTLVIPHCTFSSVLVCRRRKIYLQRR